MNQLELGGLDGANPLGFLAAVGTLNVLSESDPDIKLGWHSRARWVPFLSSPQQLDETVILTRLAGQLVGRTIDRKAEGKRAVSQDRFDAAKKKLKGANDALKKLKLRGNQLKEERERNVEPVRQKFEKRRKIVLARLKSAVPSPELALGQRPDCTIEEFRQHAVDIRKESTPTSRMAVDLLAAFGAEVSSEDDERILSTPFCFITGSGRQWFLDTARQLMAKANEDKLREALFQSWAYRDEKLTMRWDPVDDRRYALMDRDPTASDNKSTTVWMANLLAYRALALFSSVAISQERATACWFEKPSPAFCWPLWERPLSQDTIRSLLSQRAFALGDFNATNKDLRLELHAAGVAAVFSSLRIQVGNPPLHKINFSPSRAL